MGRYATTIGILGVAAISACAGSSPRSSEPLSTTTPDSNASTLAIETNGVGEAPSDVETDNLVEKTVEKPQLTPSPSQRYNASLRVDSAVGGLSKTRSEGLLRVAHDKFEKCINNADIEAPWTVGLSFDIAPTGTAKVSVEGAKAPLVSCLEYVTRSMHFPIVASATTIEGAIMIARSTVATPDTNAQKDEEEGVYGGLLGEEVGGGWGYGVAGVGPGGGGTGWGTIGGLGQIGNVPANTSGRISLGKGKTSGGLDKAIIRRYIRRRLPRIRFCYEKELLKRPKLQGTVKLRFTIGPKGNVLAANAKGVRPVVSRCVAKAVKTIQFPRPNGGGKVVVNYPFSFLPASRNVQGGVVGGVLGGLPPAPARGVFTLKSSVGAGASNPAPKVVPQIALESLRISGNKQIHPPTDVITKITHSRRRVVTVVKMCLDMSGNVTTLSMLKSSGYQSYDTKIKSEIHKWKYRPFLVNGKAVPVCTSVTFIYVPSPALTKTHTARSPKVRSGTVSTSTSALSKDVIRRVTRQAMPKIRHCYERELAKQPKLQGRVETKYTIGPDGSVGDVKVTGFHPKTSNCLKTVLSGLHFPRPKGGASVIVSYPYFFSQAP